MDLVLYPRHLFQTLLNLEFRKWPTDEQVAVIEFLECVSPYLKLDSEDSRLEWEDSIAALKDPLRFSTDDDFETITLPELAEAKLPAGADIRFLIVGEKGTIIHCTVPGLQVSKATYHAKVTEFWYVLEGRGEIWRDNGVETDVTVLAPDTSIDIPPGTAYQYRNVNVIDLKFVCIIIPPLPGDISDDTYVVKGKWQPTL
jgi:mannose-6-phosphate isomerase-like protein (cupin superfamily)